MPSPLLSELKMILDKHQDCDCENTDQGCLRLWMELHALYFKYLLGEKE